MTSKSKHFPVRSDLYPVLRFVALCGYVSDKAKEFVNPQKFEPWNVLVCCTNYPKATKQYQTN